MLTNLLSVLFGCRFHKHARPLETMIFTVRQKLLPIARCCRCGDILVCQTTFDRFPDDAIQCVRCAMRAVHDHYVDRVNSLVERVDAQAVRLSHAERFATTMRDTAARELDRLQAARL